MRRAPFVFDLLALGFIKDSWRKLLDCTCTAHVAAGEIRCFSDFSLRRFRSEAAVPDVQHPAGENAIRLVAWILGGVVTGISVKLPLFTGDPGQHARFD